MAVDWGLAGDGFNALQSLGAFQQGQDRQVQAQMRQAAFAKAQREEAAAQQQIALRQRVGGQVASGDIQGAQNSAYAAGDFDIAQAVGTVRKEHLGRLNDEFDAIGNLYPHVKALPQEARAAAAIPVLKQAGFSDQEIQNIDWSDAGVDGAYAMSKAGKAALEARLKAEEPYTLSQGQTRFQGGQALASVAPKPDYLIVPEGGKAIPLNDAPALGGASSMSGQGDTFQNMLGAESGGRQFAANGSVLTSPKGALGVAQLLPTTAPEAAALAGVPYDANRLRSDPAYNAQLGSAYYQKQLQTFGDPAQAAAAYNAGPRRVQKAIDRGGENWLQYMPTETRNYVAKVTGGAPVSSRRSATSGGDPAGTIYGAPKATNQRMTPAEVQAEGLDPRIVYYRGKDGVPQAVSGQDRKQTAQLTESQSKAVGYLSEAVAAANSLNQIQGYNPSEIANALGTLGAGNPLKRNLSQADRRAFNAQLAFGMAALRLESGAAISKEEAAQRAQVLFPQPGDGPEVQADKRAQRQAVLHALRVAAGSGADTVARARPNPADTRQPGGAVATPRNVMAVGQSANIGGLTITRRR